MAGKRQTKRAVEKLAAPSPVRRRQVEPAEAQPRGGIQSLERAAAILDVIARHPKGIGLADVSDAVGLHPSTAFHIVKTLVGLGFVSQMPENRRYRLGTRLFALAAGALDESTLLSLAMPLLERLSAETGEAAHLAVRAGGEIVVIARTAAFGMLQIADNTGMRRPAHATAIGKILLAAMAKPELDRLLKSMPLPRLTSRTITSVAALKREIDAVRDQAIAFDDREFDFEVRCMAVPVHDFAGRCAGAMGISAPASRLPKEALRQHSDLLRALAGQLSRALGGPAGD